MGEVTQATRRKVKDRDGHRCVSAVLPGPCSGGLEMGHLVRRGSGGSDLHDGPGWLITQCHRHNQQIADDAETKRQALALGHAYLANSTALLPERAQVRYPDGVWYLLNDDGTKEEAKHEYPWLDPGSTPNGDPVPPLWAGWSPGR